MNFATLNLGWFNLKGLILKKKKQTTQVGTAISGEVDVYGPFHWEIVLQWVRLAVFARNCPNGALNLQYPLVVCNN